MPGKQLPVKNEVMISSKEYRNLRERAWRRYPNEYIEAIIGHKQRKGGWRIRKFIKIPIIKATPMYVEYDVEFLRDLKKIWKTDFLGTIHTHTTLDSIPSASKWDMSDAVINKEKVIGIMHLNKSGKRKNTQLSFYSPTGIMMQVRIAGQTNQFYDGAKIKGF